MEWAAGEAEAREWRRHVVVERDDADAEDRGGRPRRAGLRRLRGRHGRRGARGGLRSGSGVCGLSGLADSNEATRGSFRSTLPVGGGLDRPRISLWAGMGWAD